MSNPQPSVDPTVPGAVSASPDVAAAAEAGTSARSSGPEAEALETLADVEQLIDEIDSALADSPIEMRSATSAALADNDALSAESNPAAEGAALSATAAAPSPPMTPPTPPVPAGNSAVDDEAAAVPPVVDLQSVNRQLDALLSEADRTGATGFKPSTSSPPSSATQAARLAEHAAPKPAAASGSAPAASAAIVAAAATVPATRATTVAATTPPAPPAPAIPAAPASPPAPQAATGTTTPAASASAALSELDSALAAQVKNAPDEIGDRRPIDETMIAPNVIPSVAIARPSSQPRAAAGGTVAAPVGITGAVSGLTAPASAASLPPRSAESNANPAVATTTRETAATGATPAPASMPAANAPASAANPPDTAAATPAPTAVAPAPPRNAASTPAKPGEAVVVVRRSPIVMILQMVNAPLRMIPANLLPLVNIAAVTLLLWAPLVWVLAAMGIGRPSPAAPVDHESAAHGEDKAADSHGSGHGAPSSDSPGASQDSHGKPPAKSTERKSNSHAAAEKKKSTGKNDAAKKTKEAGGGGGH